MPCHCSLWIDWRSGKINGGENLWLKNVIETEDGEPWADDITDRLKIELKKIKVVNNREVFGARSKEYSAHYVRNDDKRSM